MYLEYGSRHADHYPADTTPVGFDTSDMRMRLSYLIERGPHRLPANRADVVFKGRGSRWL